MERLADNVDFLSQLEYVNIAARRLFGGQLLGFRRSRRFGAGQEYADFRAYTPGDDVRQLYWQAYLQHRRLVCKLFEESAEINIYLLVDTSASMGRGSPEKRCSSPRGPGSSAMLRSRVRSESLQNCTHSDVAAVFVSSISVVVDTARFAAGIGSTLYG